MILKGSQRGGGAQLAAHLLRTDDNDHVEIHDLRGFVADDLSGAFKEAYAVSRGTRCHQFLFSLSLNPPEKENVPIAIFEDAISQIEKRMGLSGQPRAILFHEKEGRRHAHCVWSRIKADDMKAINLPHFKLKLRDVSREIYFEHGWKMPEGLVNSEERNPLNFTQDEWQQSKRLERDPREIKNLFRECWAISDSGVAFAQALEARGYYLAKGDRRGHVAVDWRGEVYSISRWVGVRAKEVRARLGEPENLTSVEDVKAKIGSLLKHKLQEFAEEQRHQIKDAKEAFGNKCKALVTAQRKERANLRDRQFQRWRTESQERAERFRKGIKGLWDRLTGSHATTRRFNESEVETCRLRDEKERHALVQIHLRERRNQMRGFEENLKEKELEFRHLSESADEKPIKRKDRHLKRFDHKRGR